MWIGHINRIRLMSIPRVAMCWNSDGKIKDGKIKRDVEEIRAAGIEVCSPTFLTMLLIRLYTEAKLTQVEGTRVDLLV